jgi:tetratricopeptide (TPR) repeat protein
LTGFGLYFFTASGYAMLYAPCASVHYFLDNCMQVFYFNESEEETLMKRIIIIPLVVLCLASQLLANDFEDQIIQARSLLEQGYYHWDEAKMQESLAQFQRLLHLEKEEWLIRFYIAFADYRLGTFYMEKDKKKAGKFLNDALNQLKKSQKQNDSFTESYALMSSCYGFKTGLAPWKGMILGPRAGLAIGKAESLGPENPRVWLLKGIGSRYTPKAFGGGKKTALEELNKAIELYEQEKPRDPILPQWGHDEAYAWVGIILKQQGHLQEAKKAFEKGLEVNPHNGWITYSLMLDLEKELGEK